MASQPLIAQPKLRSVPARTVPASPRLRVVPRVSVIVVNFQRWADTVSLVRGLRESELLRHGEAEVIIIDNHSRADRLMRVLKRWDEVTLRRCRRNRGFGSAVNSAVRRGSGDWFLLLNPDISVPRDFLDRALELAEQASGADPTAGILGFQVLNTDGTLQGSTGPFPSLPGTLARLVLPRSRRKYSQPPTIRSEVPWATGCCLMIRRDCFRELGGFDEHFFLYYEDVDLCRRAREHGWSVWFEPTLSVIHHRPLHSRSVNTVLRLITRHSLMTYARRHWSNWQTRLLAKVIRAESWLRSCLAGWRCDEEAARCFDLLGKIASAIAENREDDAWQMVQQVVRTRAIELS